MENEIMRKNLRNKKKQNYVFGQNTFQIVGKVGGHFQYFHQRSDLGWDKETGKQLENENRRGNKKKKGENGMEIYNKEIGKREW